LLRISGAAKAAKRSDREASNGLVAAAGQSMIQLGAETDFVAKNEEFMDLATTIAEAVEAAGADSVESANAVALPDGRTVAEAIGELSAKIGEKLELVKVARFTGQTHTYLHRLSPDLPPQVGVLVEFEGTSDEGVAHSIALQIAAMSPSYVHSGEISAETIEAETRIAEATAREEGKPEQIIPRIVEGRLKDFYKDSCLHDQMSISDDKVTVGQQLKDAGVVITRFARFAAGA
jgi:elongation factor Ts